MKAPRVKRVCLANLERGVPGVSLATVAPPGRRVTQGTQVLKAGMGLPDPQDEPSMWGLEEAGRRVRREILGTLVRMARRVPEVMPAPLACLERGVWRAPAAPPVHGVTLGTEACRERR
ncbi:hypothetical protein llap_22150 [Limosa lapponica baueri]|uniref:Uncharacterized protein n=1 Tax=Limosa lapponica baueri TaxID=1758121 RepID=A0A2I0T166_LIMLA|nr:hypothetical protein llap_22150 [Limosa lapponica baueri]